MDLHRRVERKLLCNYQSRLTIRLFLYDRQQSQSHKKCGQKQSRNGKPGANTPKLIQRMKTCITTMLAHDFKLAITYFVTGLSAGTICSC